MFLQEYEIALRLVLACILGGIVGWEREKIHKPAGLKTHTLVALGSALLTLISMYAFSTFLTLNKDPARIAANIVTGIGFLGAGTIIREGSSVRGLTTAASIWVVSAIGMAVAAGMYALALITTFLVFLTLEGIFERTLLRNQKLLRVRITEEEQLREIGSILKKNHIAIKHVSILPMSDTVGIPVEFKLSISKKTKFEQVVMEIIRLEGVSLLEGVALGRRR